ncbi:putative holin-like toxin, partial [Bacillus swezeyi]
YPLWKGVMQMTAYETISLMIAFGMLIAVLSKKEKPANVCQRFNNNNFVLKKALLNKPLYHF